MNRNRDGGFLFDSLPQSYHSKLANHQNTVVNGRYTEGGCLIEGLLITGFNPSNHPSILQNTRRKTLKFIFQTCPLISDLFSRSSGWPELF